MTPTNTARLVACAIVALIMMASASAQSRRVDNGSATMQRFAFHWETQLNPPTPPLADGSFFSTFDETAPNQVHRMLMDRTKRVYFGYTVEIQSHGDGRTFRLTFFPLTLTVELRKRLGDDAESWKALPSTKFPAPQTIRSGEVLELNLLSNDNWGQQLAEFVTVQEVSRPEGFFRLDGTTREFSFATGRPRDLTVADVVLRLKDPRLFVNGRFEESSSRTLGEQTGGVVWIYIPTRGRFLLTVVQSPKQGFTRAGEIRGSSLRFTVGGNTYSVNSGASIAPGTAAYNLYVLHQAEWRPSYPNANVDIVSIGAADSVDAILSDGRKTYSAETMRDNIRK